MIENKSPDHEKLRIEPNKPIYSGAEALMYVRYREDSDFKRTERQRIFLKSALERMKRVDNILNIQKIIEIAGSNFQTNMKSDFILDLAKRVILEGVLLRSQAICCRVKADGRINGIICLTKMM